jgi:hypothetical protein
MVFRCLPLFHFCSFIIPLGYLSRGSRINSIFVLYCPYLLFLCYFLVLSTNLIQMVYLAGKRGISFLSTLLISGTDRKHGKPRRVKGDML